MLAAAGCTTRLGDFTVISTKNFDTDDQYEMVGTFEGKSSVLVLFGIPFGTPDIESAIDEALDNGGGTYMANAVLSLVQSPFQIAYTVRGDVYKPAGMAARQSGDVYRLQQRGDELVILDPSGAAVGVVTTP